MTSYFMRMVELDNTKRATYTRNHDERVCEIQFPVGWTFFTRTNIDAILKRLAAKGFKVDMAYITPLLQWAYESPWPHNGKRQGITPAEHQAIERHG